jgi:hypothetical protein
MANTGNKIYTTLLKVVDGGLNDGQALDANNNLISASGLPQASKLNTFGQPDYIAPFASASCSSVTATGFAGEDPQFTDSVEVKAFVSSALTVDITVVLEYTESTSVSTIRTTNVVIVAGTLSTVVPAAFQKVDPTADITYIGVQDVFPNPAGGTTITF